LLFDLGEGFPQLLQSGFLRFFRLTFGRLSVIVRTGFFTSFVGLGCFGVLWSFVFLSFLLGFARLDSLLIGLDEFSRFLRLYRIWFVA
jgi:hypothetical protein